MVGGQCLRPHLVIAMYAQDFDAMLVEFLFPVAIAVLVAIVIHAHIAQDHNGVLRCNFITLNHVGYPQGFAMDISGNVNHFLSSPSGMG